MGSGACSTMSAAPTSSSSSRSRPRTWAGSAPGRCGGPGPEGRIHRSLTRSVCSAETVAGENWAKARPHALGAGVMHGVTFPKGTEGWSRHQANTLLRTIEDLLHRADIEGL